MDLTEAEEVARIHRRTVQKELHGPDNHDGVITHLEPDILECEVKWALGMGRDMGGGSGLGTRVHLWWIQVDVWQNQYSIVK